MSTFFSGLIDPVWPHVILLSVAILASFAVAVGIVLESPHWSVANALVVGGVAFEAVCTLLLFGFDEGISNAQQSKIVRLESRLAARSLSETQVSDLKNSLRKFPGQHFQLFSYKYAEASDMAAQIGEAALAVGWIQDPLRPNTFLMSVMGGISVNIDDGASAPVKEAAGEIISALKEASIDATEDHRNNPQADVAVIGIAVGIKP
jgi:hypothetical protein